LASSAFTEGNSGGAVVDPVSLALLSPHRGKPSGVDAADTVPLNFAAKSPPATLLPPPEVESAPAPAKQGSPHHSPAFPMHDAAYSPLVAPSRTHKRRTEARFISLHDPSLCLETFFTLRIMDDHDVSEDDVAERADVEATVSEGKNKDGDSRSAAVFSTAPLLHSGTVIYTSEVARGTHHPNWSSIPGPALKPCSQSVHLELSVFYTAPFLLKADTLAKSGSPANVTNAHRSNPVDAHGDDWTPLHSDVCVHRCRIDMRRTFYLGATLEEADVALSRLLRLEEQRAPCQRGLPRPLLYLRCSDGIFVPTSCFSGWHAPVAKTLHEWQVARTRTFCPAPAASDFQGTSPFPSSVNTIAGRNSLAAVAAAQAAAACTEVPWSCAPSSVGWRYPPFASPRAGQPRATLGDLKAAAQITLAWEWLADAAEQRQAALADRLDAAATAHPTELAVAAQYAALRVQLSAAREGLTFSSLALENLREAVRQRQRRLLAEEEALAAVHHYGARVTSQEAVAARQEQVRKEEAQRAQLRAHLARVRQRRVQELCLMYTVTLSSHYASHVCTTPADAKDHINSAGLPVLFVGRADANAASHLVASTADAMHEEAVALGHACHLLTVLSILYSCALPYPLLLGGGQSHVLASSNLDPALVLASPYTLTEGRKYPLSCRRAADRPLMMVGVHLLLRNGAVLAKAMGKPERRVAACADRLGAMLDLLLHDVE
jgi:hypothetical protein